MKGLGKTSLRYIRLLKTLNRCINLFNENPDDPVRCRRCLGEELEKRNGSTVLTTFATGHAHIDTAWLWRKEETKRKCARTFACQLHLLEKYPDYRFGASSPLHYQYMKEHYPDLFEQIKKAVAGGRWEPLGCM